MSVSFCMKPTETASGRWSMGKRRVGKGDLNWCVLDWYSIVTTHSYLIWINVSPGNGLL